MIKEEGVKAREDSSIIYDPIYDPFMCVRVCVRERLRNPRCPLLKIVEQVLLNTGPATFTDTLILKPRGRSLEPWHAYRRFSCSSLVAPWTHLAKNSRPLRDARQVEHLEYSFDNHRCQSERGVGVVFDASPASPASPFLELLNFAHNAIRRSFWIMRFVTSSSKSNLKHSSSVVTWRAQATGPGRP